MIPDVDRKWSHQKIGMAWSVVSWIFLSSYFIFIFIYFHELKNELDKHKEKIVLRRKL